MDGIGVNDPELARAVVVSADDLEHRGWLRAGLLRQAARRLVELSAEVDGLRVARAGEGCAVCGAPLTQPARGRRRLYCSTACRRSARNARNGRMAP